MLWLRMILQGLFYRLHLSSIGSLSSIGKFRKMCVKIVRRWCDHYDEFKGLEENRKTRVNFKINYVAIPALVALCLWVGAVITLQGMEWYNNDLLLSPLTPPSSVFRVAWSFIGFCTALSIITLWNRSKRDIIFWATLAVFALNGILNVSWSYVFFIRHEIARAFWVAAAIEGTVLLLMCLTWGRSHKAALLLLPYAVWMLFALYLTNDMWLINEAI